MRRGLPRIGIALLVWAVAGRPVPAAPERTPVEKPAEKPAEREREEPSEPDRIGPELEKRIRSQAKREDLRIEVSWPLREKTTSARVFGNGVGIWNRKAQFRMTQPLIVAMLKALMAERFGSMPGRFGESEEDERNEERKEGRNEGPRLKGRISVRAGWVTKTVVQLFDGEQSPEFAQLAERLLSICEEPARKTVEAGSLDDGLRKLASRALAPETLQVTVQRRFAKPEGEAAGWILQLEGRRAIAEVLPAGKKLPAQRLRILTPREFQELTSLLAGSRAGEIPINVYSPEYTDIRLTALRWSRAISGRRFLNLTAETHGDAQKSFDRLFEALRAVHQRTRKDGIDVPASVWPPPRGESEAEREREREREREPENGREPRS